MKKLLLTASVAIASGSFATPFTGNDASSSAMGNTGVASATPQNAFQFNPGLLADYPDRADFGLTLPSVKFFIDDSAGLVEATDDFVNGGVWEDFQAIDAAAFETAVTNTPTTITNVQGDITDIANTITAIQADLGDGTLDDPTLLDDLDAASLSLSNNSAQLDNDITTLDTQAGNLDTAVTSAFDGLQSLNSKPLQLGVGIDALNAAIPSERLAMAISISTSTTVGIEAKLSAEDQQPVEDLLEDLTGLTGEASQLTTELSTLADINLELSAHLQTQPDVNDYAGYGDPAYISAMDTWTTELDEINDRLTTQSTAVESAMTDITNYSGNYYSAGSLNEPTVGDLTSEMDIVGANISEIGVSLARKFTIYGEEVAIGVTPKLQSINIFEKTIGLATYEDELDAASADPTGYFTESTTMLYRANIDVGAAKSWDFYGRVRAGVAVKDIIPWTLESNTGTELLIRPKVRIGAAHETRFSTLAIDLDVTENKPLKYGVPTRYFGVGAELNAFGWAALRAGYRNNLSVDNAHVITGGIGLTPFGTGLSISGWVKPTFDDPVVMVQDAGAVVQLSMNF